MTPQTVFEQTPRGVEEIKTRKWGLPTDLRMVLLLVDGRRSLESLVLLSEFLRQSTAPLTALLDGGYIAIAGEAQVRAPVQELARLQQSQPLAATGSDPRSKRAIGVPASPSTTNVVPIGRTSLRPAAAEADIDPLLLRAKADMRSHVLQVMGEDASAVCQRIEHCQTRQDLLTLLSKLHDILKNYASTAEADQLIKRLDYL